LQASLPSFLTIQAAVMAAPAGSTIDVCPRTYPAQVAIGANSLTLIGIVAGTSDAAVLIPPSGGLAVNASDLDGGPVAAQIFVENSIGVTISHLNHGGQWECFARLWYEPDRNLLQELGGKTHRS
jgi:hypothetical protein